MIESGNGRVTSVAWAEICPWLIIFRTFRLAIRARFLIISALAILATTIGWYLIGMVFSGSGDEHLQAQIAAIAPPGSCPWTSITNMVPDSPGYPHSEKGGSFFQQGNPITLVWNTLSTPFRRMFSLEVTVSELAFWLLCGFWMLLVWSFAGGAITRTTAVQLAADEKLDWSSMTSYVLARWRSYFAAPLFPLLGVLLVTIPILILGLLLRTGPTTWIAGLVWFLPLAGGLLASILLLGLLFGWPLMWATISSEGTDSFDALSRSYAYTFQRPLQYLLYAIVAAVFGGSGLAFGNELCRRCGTHYLLVGQLGRGQRGRTRRNVSRRRREYRAILDRLRKTLGRGLSIQLFLDRLDRHLFRPPPRRRCHGNGRSLPGRGCRRIDIRVAHDRKR